MTLWIPPRPRQWVTICNQAGAISPTKSDLIR
jgi:hypothetical protein